MRPDFEPMGRTLFCIASAFLVIAVVTSSVSIEKTHDARATAARAHIAAFQIALENYYSDVREYPTEKQGLDALRLDPGVIGWRGPYLLKDVPGDPWGHPYQYRVLAGGPEVLSLGGGSTKGERVIASGCVQ